MSKPEDIPQDVWDVASDIFNGKYAVEGGLFSESYVAPMARAILAAKVEERSILTDAGRDNDALNSAVGVLRTQQAQPHKSTQSILWEAIQDYAERAKVSTAHKNSEVQ